MYQPWGRDMGLSIRETPPAELTDRLSGSGLAVSPAGSRSLWGLVGRIYGRLPTTARVAHLGCPLGSGRFVLYRSPVSHRAGLRDVAAPESSRVRGRDLRDEHPLRALARSTKEAHGTLVPGDPHPSGSHHRAADRGRRSLSVGERPHIRRGLLLGAIPWRHDLRPRQGKGFLTSIGGESQSMQPGVPELTATSPGCCTPPPSGPPQGLIQAPTPNEKISLSALP